MEVQVFANITGTACYVLAYVLCDVVGGGHPITDGGKGTEPKSTLVVRPVEKAAVYELLRLRIAERTERRSGQAVDQTVNMPRTILVKLRHEQHLKRGVILLALVPDKLHEPLCIAIQVIAICQLLIQCAGKKVVPGIAEGILQHHRPGTAETVVQFRIIVLCLFAETREVRITVAFERHDLVNLIGITVYGVHRGNRHIPTPSRKTL